MLYKFFIAQWEDPIKKDWVEQVRTDLEDLGIKLNLDEIEMKSEMTFKKMVKVKIKEFALDSLNEMKYEHSKMDNVIYTELNIQTYLMSEELSVEQKRIIFHFRTRMANFAENFRGQNPSIPCKICLMHVDSQEHGVNCTVTKKSLKKAGKYEEIFTNNITVATAQMLQELVEFRKEQLE